MDTSDLLNKFSGKIICVDGSIAVGKSVLCSALRYFFNSRNIPVEVVPENINLELLKQFNDEPKKYATLFQYEMLIRRMHTLLKAVDIAKTGKVVILDTGFLRDIAFSTSNYAVGNMAWADMETLHNSFANIWSSLDFPYPDFMVILDTHDVTKCKQNIADRDRLNEDKLSEEYLDATLEAYRKSHNHHFIQNAKIDMKTIFVDTTKHFATAEKVLEILLQQ